MKRSNLNKVALLERRKSVATSITPITQEYIVDMSSNNNFIQIPAVQGDGNYVRYVLITLIENGIPYNIPSNIGVYVVGTKPDNQYIFNECEIVSDSVQNRSSISNKIKFEITSQMSAASGRGEYQIMFIDLDTNSQIKSFPFYIMTTKSFNAKEFTSTSEYQAIVELMNQMIDDYSHYVVECQEAADEANGYKAEAQTSATNAATSATNAHTSEVNAKSSETKSKTSETNAKTSETNAANSATSASTSATNSANSATTSANKAKDAEAWAVGQRNGVDVSSSDVTYHNNSKYWAERAADWSQHDASHLTYTLEDGTQVNLASFLKIIEDLDGETLLLL